LTASTVMRAASFTVSVLWGASISIMVVRFSKKSRPSWRRTGAGSISSTAAVTHWRSRAMGTSRNTWWA